MSQQELTFGDKAQPKYTYEIVVQIRDAQGNPTGKTKSFSSDYPDKISNFWHRMHGKPKRKRRKEGALPKGKEADKLAKEAGQYAKSKQQKRDNKES